MPPKKRKSPESPFKSVKAKPQSSKSNRKKVPANSSLTVYGFGADLPFEAYMYTKGSADGYIHPFRMFVNGGLADENLSEAGFFACYNGRLNKNSDETLFDENGYPRVVMMRQVPENAPSTSSTRAEGLQMLKDFFMRPGLSRWIPPDIAMIDETNDTNLLSMDNFVRNQDIMTVMRTILDSDVLNASFYDDYRHIADAFFGGNALPYEAMELGFPRERRVSAPNFVFPASGNGPRGNRCDSRPDP